MRVFRQPMFQSGIILAPDGGSGSSGSGPSVADQAFQGVVDSVAGLEQTADSLGQSAARFGDPDDQVSSATDRLKAASGALDGVLKSSQVQSFQSDSPVRMGILAAAGTVRMARDEISQIAAALSSIDMSVQGRISAEVGDVAAALEALRDHVFDTEDQAGAEATSGTIEYPDVDAIKDELAVVVRKIEKARKFMTQALLIKAEDDNVKGLFSARESVEGIVANLGKIADALNAARSSVAAAAPAPAEGTVVAASASVLQGEPSVEVIASLLLGHDLADCEWLERGAMRGMFHSVSEALRTHCARLMLVFGDQLPATVDKDDSSKTLINAYYRAWDVLGASGIEGASEFLRDTDARLANWDYKNHSVRGFVRQLILLGNILAGGRVLDAVNIACGKAVESRTWSLDVDMVVIAEVEDQVAPDARAQSTVIEISSGIFDAMFANVLNSLFMMSRGDSLSFDDLMSISGVSDRTVFNRRLGRAMRIAGQMDQYRKFIKSGQAEKFELHVMSRMLSPAYLEVIFKFFPKDSVVVYHYIDILNTDPKVISHIPSLAKPAPVSKTPSKMGRLSTASHAAITPKRTLRKVLAPSAPVVTHVAPPAPMQLEEYLALVVSVSDALNTLQHRSDYVNLFIAWVMDAEKMSDDFTADLEDGAALPEWKKNRIAALAEKWMQEQRNPSKRL